MEIPMENFLTNFEPMRALQGPLGHQVAIHGESSVSTGNRGWRILVKGARDGATTLVWVSDFGQSDRPECHSGPPQC